MNKVNGIDVTNFKYVKGETKSTSDSYQQDTIEPFRSANLNDCCNLWGVERYEEPILKKAIPLYKSYTRKNSTLIGNGDLIGYIAYITGKAYRGMGANGSSCRRTKGIGLVLSKGTKMEKVLGSLGLYNSKNPRFRNLTASMYTLVTKIHTTVYTNGNTLKYLEIGLQGNDGSYIDLTTKYTKCMTLNFK